MLSSPLHNRPRNFDARTTREANDQRNMTNGKPYRTAELKREARQNAVKIDGTWVSDTKVLFHTKPKGNA